MYIDIRAGVKSWARWARLSQGPVTQPNFVVLRMGRFNFNSLELIQSPGSGLQEAHFILNAFCCLYRKPGAQYTSSSPPSSPIFGVWIDSLLVFTLKQQQQNPERLKQQKWQPWLLCRALSLRFLFPPALF